MNKENLDEIKTKELLEKVRDKKLELFQLRFKNAVGELTDTSLIKKTRKTIARMLTEINSRKTNNKRK